MSESKVNMKHRPMGGEVQGVRETMDSFQKQLVENGASPERARELAVREAHKMEERMGRPRRSRSR